jgi:hypothetical protein
MVDTLTPSTEQHRLIASDRVEGTRVYNSTGEKLGSIKNFLVDKVTGKADYAVIEFGGILGMGSDFYPIPWEVLSYDREKGGYVVPLSKERLNDAPRHGANFPEYDHNYGRRIFEYYGLAYPYPFI